jgi:hypothetical protein
MTISETQLLVALSLGQLAPGLRSGVVVGRNPAVGATEEDIWEGGGTYSFLSSASALEIVSSSTDDASAGTGARTVTLDLLDAAGDEQRVTVTLNGTTPVAVGTYYRVNGGFVASAGSNGSNVGAITLRTVSGAVTQLVIAAGNGVSAQFIYTAPRGHTVVTGSFFFSAEQASGGAGTSNLTTVSTLTRANGSNSWLRTASFSINEDVATTELRPWPTARTLPALTDFRFAAACATASMRVHAGIRFLIAKNGVNFAPRFAAWAGGSF